MAPLACFDRTSFVFSSPRPPLRRVPTDLDMVSFLFSLTSSARSFHHRLAIVDASTGQGFTFLQLRRHVDGVARALSFLGVNQHDVVLILSPNSIHFPVLFFAIISLGAIATTANPSCVPTEIHKQIEDSKSKLILADPELAGKVVDFALPVILIDGCEPSATSKPGRNPSVNLLSDVMKQACNHRVPPVKIKQTDVAALLYSSGTTGVSKGVVLSHRNFITGSLQNNTDADLHKQYNLTFLCIVPMFHAYGLTFILYEQLQQGNTLITMRKFDFIHMLQAIEMYRVTNLPVVPPIMIALAKHDAVEKFDLSSVIEIMSGAAPVGEDTLMQVYRRLKVPDIRQAYGLTETSGVVSITILKDSEKNYAAVGPLVSGAEAVIVDPSSGKRLPPKEKGEIWLRGPNIMQGYLNNPEATAATLDREGWLHTGDIGHFDDKGNLYIIDRIKELIKYKGFQVAPAELEALLLTNPGILDAAVVPCPDVEAGEIPVAFVVRVLGSSLTEQDIIRFVVSQVAPHKMVRRVKFIDVIPKSSSGKILRRQLTKSLQSNL